MIKKIRRYWGNVLFNISFLWLSSNIWANVLKAILGAITTMIAGIGGLFYGVSALLVIDAFFGTVASIKKGHSFQSAVLRKGLLEKFLLYCVLFIVTYIVEAIVKLSLPYQDFYLVGLYAALVGFYEMSSIVEKLMIIYPTNKVLERLAKWLNVWNKQIDSKAENLLS